MVPESTWPAVVENLPDPVLLARREATAARQVGSLASIVASPCGSSDPIDTECWVQSVMTQTKLEQES